jgi:hypothetical protein
MSKEIIKKEIEYPKIVQYLSKYEDWDEVNQIYRCVHKNRLHHILCKCLEFCVLVFVMAFYREKNE